MLLYSKSRQQGLKFLVYQNASVLAFLLRFVTCLFDLVTYVSHRCYSISTNMQPCLLFPDNQSVSISSWIKCDKPPALQIVSTCILYSGREKWCITFEVTHGCVIVDIVDSKVTTGLQCIPRYFVTFARIRRQKYDECWVLLTIPRTDNWFLQHIEIRFLRLIHKDKYPLTCENNAKSSTLPKGSNQMNTGGFSNIVMA